VSVLDGILDGVREDLAPRQREVSLAELKARASAMSSARDPLPAFRSAGASIIAEDLADIPDPAALAADYAAGGASAISVLTERRRFGGSLADLASVREAVGIPVLRKDFTVEPYQIWEARVWGADLVLLMTVSLTGGLLGELLGITRQLGLTALVEVHNEDELARAVASART
jgi:indole-3-glycerol phosphate synthase